MLEFIFRLFIIPNKGFIFVLELYTTNDNPLIAELGYFVFNNKSFQSMAQSFEQQVEKELKSMDQRLYDLEEKMTSIDTKLSQVVDAILGNSLTKTGGFVKDIDDLKLKIKELEDKLQKQEEFKKKFTWTIGIVLAIAAILQYVANILSKVN
jgi:hypothetical protein